MNKCCSLHQRSLYVECAESFFYLISNDVPVENTLKQQTRNGVFVHNTEIYCAYFYVDVK